MGIFVREAAGELVFAPEVTRRDLGPVVLELEALQDQQIGETLAAKEETIERMDKDEAHLPVSIDCNRTSCPKSQCGGRNGAPCGVPAGVVVRGLILVDDSKIPELPYGAAEYSMDCAAAPDKRRPFTVGTSVNGCEPAAMERAMKRADNVQVSRPKFQVSVRLDLKTTLQTLGMKSAFDANVADFSDMSVDQDLFLSAVLYKAFVGVNEQGTEAVAATGSAMGTTSMPINKRPPVFRADHSFVFLIRDNPSGAILLLGRRVNPAINLEDSRVLPRCRKRKCMEGLQLWRAAIDCASFIASNDQ